MNQQNPDVALRDAAREIRREVNRKSRESGYSIQYGEPDLDLTAYHYAHALFLKGAAFSALVASAYMRADTVNRRIIEAAFPLIAQQTRQRYDSPGGVLPDEKTAA